METAYFNRFELSMTFEQAQGASHQGKCDDDVEELIGQPEIVSQLDAIDAGLIRNLYSSNRSPKFGRIGRLSGDL